MSALRISHCLLLKISEIVKYKKYRNKNNKAFLNHQGSCIASWSIRKILNWFRSRYGFRGMKLVRLEFTDRGTGNRLDNWSDKWQSVFQFTRTSFDNSHSRDIVLSFVEETPQTFRILRARLFFYVQLYIFYVCNCLSILPTCEHFVSQLITWSRRRNRSKNTPIVNRFNTPVNLQPAYRLCNIANEIMLDRGKIRSCQWYVKKEDFFHVIPY